jgi:hypothetical protein
VSDFGAEVFFDLFGGRFGIFNDVVQQSSRDADRIEVEIGQNVCDFEWVDKIRLARLSRLSSMLARREQVRPAQKLLVGVGMILSELFYYRFEPNHC